MTLLLVIKMTVKVENTSLFKLYKLQLHSATVLTSHIYVFAVWNLTLIIYVLSSEKLIF